MDSLQIERLRSRLQDNLDILDANMDDLTSLTMHTEEFGQVRHQQRIFARVYSVWSNLTGQIATLDRHMMEALAIEELQKRGENDEG